MKKLSMILFMVITCLFHVSLLSATVRLKDVAVIKDQREMQLIGYGLVVGLDGSGDGKNTQFTIRSIGNMIKNMGIEVPSTSIKVKNVAAVMVTATVSPYVKSGGTFDVTVSSLGDASSLEGGTLLMTNLSSPDGVLYAIAQGPISVGGSNKNYGTGQLVQNKQLVGLVSDGGILERELPPSLSNSEKSLEIALRSPDFTTAYRLASAINMTFMDRLATARDAGTIVVKVPSDYAENNDMVRFISEMEVVTFIPDEKAKVIINERTGTIVAGATVSLSPVAIMHGTLSLRIEGPQQGAAQAPQAAPQAQAAQATAAPPAQAAPPAPVTTVEPLQDRMVTFNENNNVGEVARALNMLGATPRDIIAIFQALKSAGSLRAELIII